MKTVDKKVVKIPVPANYVTDGKKENEKDENYYECWLIAGIKKDQIRIMTYGGIKIPVFFIEVPEEQAKELLSLTWAEFNYDRAKRKRSADGNGDLMLDYLEVDIEDPNAEDPLQNVIDKEALDTIDEIISYLESLDPLYAVIFKERLNGNFNKSDISKKIGKPVPTGHRWVRKVEELVQEFYELRDNL